MKICEMFRSIQGEGLMIGALTFFVRTSGCNLDCKWCDTRYSKTENGTDIPISEIIESIGDTRDVCITGGEPLLQSDVYELMEALLEQGKRIVLETNGSISLENVPCDPRLIISMDIKCPSSGMEEHMMLSNMELLKSTDQLKFVVENGGDLEYALRLLELIPVKCEVIFSPVGGMDIEPLAEEIVERRLNVRVLPQLHKIIWGNKRSV